MRILVCDDRDQELAATVEAIKAGWSGAGFEPQKAKIVVAGKDVLKDAIPLLFESVQLVLDGKAPKKTVFDDNDLIFIDNNLAELEIKGARHTAETISGYVRGFCECSYIVALNRDPHMDFDLRWLIGDPTTQADLALRSQHLANPALWRTGAPATKSFRPWYWPVLSTAPARRSAQLLQLKSNLDRPILDFFQMPALARTALSRSAIAALSSVADGDANSTADEITFASYFLDTAQSLLEPERQSVKSNPVVVARVIASEMERWLRRDVLAPQDVLVDVPHLLARIPNLLEGDASSLAAWNAEHHCSPTPTAIRKDIAESTLRQHHFKATDWLDCAAYWWPAVNEEEAITSLLFEDSNAADFVFCEDTSLFAERGSGEDSGPLEFATLLDSPWDRRFVANLPEHVYVPRTQFAK